MSAMSDGSDFLVLIPAGNSLAITRWNGNQAKLVASVNATAPLAFSSAPNGVIELTSAAENANGRLLLVNAKGGETPILLDAPAATFDWHDDRLLYTDGFDLHLFAVSKKTNVTLTHVEEPIIDVSWHPAGSVVAYAQANGITAIELDERDHRTVTNLVAGSGIRGAWIDPKGHALRAVETGGLIARPL
jgi:hypothetical protein